VPLFRCPSDAQEPLYEETPGVIVAGGNYFACSGSGTGTFYDVRYPTDGLFYFGGNLGLRDIIDGSSNTMVMAESLLGSGRDETGKITCRNVRERLICAKKGQWQLNPPPQPGFAGVVQPRI